MAVSLSARDRLRLDERSRSAGERALILRLAADQETEALDYLYPYAARVVEPFTGLARTIGVLVLSAVVTRRDGELVAYLSADQAGAAERVLARLLTIQTGVVALVVAEEGETHVEAAHGGVCGVGDGVAGVGGAVGLDPA